MFHEPFWVFYRGDGTLGRIGDLKGKRIAIGPEGSGTRVLALGLLKANGLADGAAVLSPLTNAAAADALGKGDLDVVFLAMATESPLIKRLLTSPDIKVMSLSQADAYAKLYPFLSKLTLPQGVIDLVGNVPATDVHLLGPDAALVVRDDLHPAIVELLAEAAQTIHGGPGLFQKAGDFPTRVDPEFEMASEAERLYKQGPGFLRRYLPFWLANQAQRLFVMLVPILGIILPLSRIVPAAFRWRVRQRILTWYTALKNLERRIASASADESHPEFTDELNRIEGAVRKLPVPVGFAEQLYNLRSHIALVRNQIAAAKA